MKISVLGCGAWGTTLAKILAENKHDVLLWCHDQTVAESVVQKQVNDYLPGIKLPTNIKTTTDLMVAAKQAEVLVVVTASEFFKSTLEKLRGYLLPSAYILSATKGLDSANDQRMSEIMLEVFPEYAERLAVLSGPNISMEIARQQPAVTVISSTNVETAKTIQELFNSPYFRVYTNDDVIGTELGGTLKNIIAIAAGVIDGLELGNNTKSALMVRGMVEMSKLAVRMGAKQETLFGLTGMGDLITTCSSSLSRNHYVGQELAKGRKLPEILKGMKAVAEGVNTTKAAFDLAKKHQVAMPVTEQMYYILFQHKDIKEAVRDLMNRDLKPEI
jgi:glycerol-3-phosphate dehydrogenase (NAD(P)+)